MKKTAEERFAILRSKLKRHQQACDMPNVQVCPKHVAVDLKNGAVLQVSGSCVQLDGTVVELGDILQVKWITPRDDASTQARLKRERFDCVYLETNDGVVAVEGMGQAVFPVMSFLQWAIQHG